MSEPTTENQTKITNPREDWEPRMPPSPEELIYDDADPLESDRHRINIDLLVGSLNHAWVGRKKYFAGGNMFIYYSSSQLTNRDFKGADFFVVLNAEDNHSRKAWVAWDEGGLYPHMVVEFTSPATIDVDLNLKKSIYQNTFYVRDYFIYDPFDLDIFQGWSLRNRSLDCSLEPNEKGWLWCETLGLWLGIWSGTIEQETASWLRFYDREGNLLYLPGEAEQLVIKERQRADRLAARLRELGEDPEIL